MITVNVDLVNYNKAMSYIQSYSNNNDYGLVTNSCVHAAISTFQHIGITQSQGPIFSAPPSAVYDSIRRAKLIYGSN